MELFEVYSKGKDITVFDVDDTLVVTKSKIKVFNPKTGYEIELTPQEFNTFKTKAYDKFDFSDFRDLEILKGGKIIEWVFNILKRTIAKGKPIQFVILGNTYDQLIEWKENIKKEARKNPGLTSI